MATRVQLEAKPEAGAGGPATETPYFMKVGRSPQVHLDLLTVDFVYGMAGLGQTTCLSPAVSME